MGRDTKDKQSKLDDFYKKNTRKTPEEIDSDSSEAPPVSKKRTTLKAQIKKSTMDPLEEKKDEVLAEQKIPSQSAPIVERRFDDSDQEKLSENEHSRFISASQKVGHALISFNSEGKLVAQQFNAPGTLNPETSQIVPLHGISLIEKFGALHAQAIADDGTRMVSKRSIEVETNAGTDYAQKHELFCFSPELSHQWKGSIWWGPNQNKSLPLFKSNLDAKTLKELEKEVEEAGVKIRGGEIEIIHKDVPVRDGMTRTPQQNTVMKRSAIDAYQEFFQEYEEELSNERTEVFSKAENARADWRSTGLKSQPRPEWLHALGYGLYPLDKDPQKVDNLAAAPKWLNTKMMVTERALKWHAMNRPNSELSLKAEFEMLMDSDLIEKGFIEGRLKEGNQSVVLKQQLNPWVKNPNYHKSTDIAQTTLVTHHLLTEVAPKNIQDVQIAPGSKLVDGPLAAGYQPINGVRISNAPSSASYLPPSSKAIPIPKAKSSNGGAESEKSNSSSNFKAPNATAKPQSSAGSLPLAKPKVHFVEPEAEFIDPSDEEVMPTQSPFERSVVQISSTFHMEDYETPWKGTEPLNCTGSGFVIERGGKKYILTNAHVVENSTYLQVRLANNDTTYTAKPLKVSYQADIALLEVSDPEFNKRTKPVTLGNMVKVRDKVTVVGFPMGGEELSTTGGIISRIQVDDYVQNGERGLMAQTEAPINPGNSGGPVFLGDNLAGIAFQGYNGADGLGYLIPMPVVNHFLNDYFSPGAYRGFPTLNFSSQQLTNPSIRKELNLSEDQTGVRITRVDPLSESFGKLVKGDILLKIDGFKVTNDGKTHIPGIGNRIDFNYLFQRKFIGDKVQLEVLRENPATQTRAIHKIEVELKWLPGETKVVPSPEYEKPPTYFIASGVLFQPLTMNYLETSHGKQLREMMVPKHGYLTDVPKDHIDDQLVIINRIFDSEVTKGYEFYENNVVSKINGQKISNIKGALKAIEDNKGAYHRIEVSSGELLVVKNLTKAENKELLKPYRVKQDRSDDLKTEASALKKAPVAQPVVEAVQSDASRKQIAIDFLKELGICPDFVKGMSMTNEEEQSEDLLSQDSSRSDDSDVDADEYDLDDDFIDNSDFRQKGNGGAVVFSDLKARTSGGAHFLQTLQNLEARYGNEFEAENDEDELDDSFELSDEESEVEAKPLKRLRKRG